MSCNLHAFSSLAAKRRYTLKSPALAFLKLNMYASWNFEKSSGGYRGTLFYAGNHTESEADMKKAKNMTVVYYGIEGKPKRNKSRYRILKSARLKIKLYLNKKKCGLQSPMLSRGIVRSRC